MNYNNISNSKSNYNAINKCISNRNKITFLADRHWIIPQLIPKEPINVLEIGGGSLFSYQFVLENEVKEKIQYYNYDATHPPNCDDVNFIQFIEGQTKFPIKDKMFDLIIAMDVIEHIKDTELFINELKRVLKNNGAIIITTPNYSNLKFTLKLLQGKMAHDPLGSEIEKYTFDEHVKYFTSKNFYPYMESLGLYCEAKIAHSLYVNHKLNGLNVIYKPLLKIYNFLPTISDRYSHNIIGVFRKKNFNTIYRRIKV